MKNFLCKIILLTFTINTAFCYGFDQPVTVASTQSSYVVIRSIKPIEYNQKTGIPSVFILEKNSFSFVPAGVDVVLVDVKTGNKFRTVYQGPVIRNGSSYEGFGDFEPLVEGSTKTKPESSKLTIDNKTEVKSDIGSAVNETVGKVITAGIVYSFYNEYIFDKEFRRNQANIVQLSKETNEIYKYILDQSSKYSQETLNVYNNLGEYLNANATRIFNPNTDNYVFKSEDSSFTQELKNIRSILNTVPDFDIRSAESKKIGLEFTEIADGYNASGDSDNARVFKEYAQWMIDLAFGLDPVTGPIRDIYEAFSGKNIITNEDLSGFERGIAVFGAISFGFGSKIGKAVKVLAELEASKRFFQKLPGISDRFKRVASKGLVTPERFANRDWDKVVEAYRHGPAQGFLNDIAKNEPEKLFHYSELVNKTKSTRIRTPDSKAIMQEFDKKHLDAYYDIISGNDSVVRQGRYPGLRSKGSKSIILGERPQYWSYEFDKLGTVEHNMAYGAYTDKVEFIEYGIIKKDAKFITRPAPPGVLIDGTVTPGGAIEIVVEPGGVEKTMFKDLTGTVE